MQPNHPDDERLAALAASETDAVVDSSLVTHVAGCPRCGPMVDDLRTLRSALAELPDITPSRPLRFLPVLPEASRQRLGWLGLLRGLTTPAMAVAVVLILVGAIGTMGGGLGSLGSAGAAPVSGDLNAAAGRASGAPVPAAQQPGASKSREGSGATSAPTPALPLSGNFGGGSPTASATDQRTRSLYQPSTKGSAETLTADSGGAPFGWLLGAGVILLAAAFVARGYVRRRSLA